MLVPHVSATGYTMTRHAPMQLVRGSSVIPMTKRFLPLESNPEVFNQLLANIGVEGVEFQDVWSIDEEMLAFLPRPVLAVVLVFPISETYEKYRQDSDKSVPDYDLKGDSEKVAWYRQTIANACGTMALLHAVANVVPASDLHGFAKKLVDDTKPLGPEDRATYLEESSEFENAHASVAVQGSTAAPSIEDEVEFHFVCLAVKDGQLVELDGRRKGPVFRGPASGDAVGPEGIAAIKEFIDRENTTGFGMMALVEK